MDQLTTETRSARRYTKRITPDFVGGKLELTFKDIHELCAFVAAEINLSRKKYNRFASEIGMSHGTVSRMATGQTQHPRAETVFSMLRALGYEVVVRGA